MQNSKKISAIKEKLKDSNGFTLVELLIVVSIISILAGIAIPQFSTYKKRAYDSEAYSLVPQVFHAINDFYSHTGTFPKNNKEAGLPEPSVLKGKIVSSIKVEEGLVIVSFNFPEKEYESEKYGKGMVFKADIPGDGVSSPIVWERQEKK